MLIDGDNDGIIYFPDLKGGQHIYTHDQRLF